MARPPTRVVDEVARQLADVIDRELRKHLGPISVVIGPSWIPVAS